MPSYISKIIATATSLGLAAILLTSCAQGPSQNNYNAAEVGHAAQIIFGKVISMRNVNVTGEKSGVGTVGGGVGGAVLGSTIGQGSGSVASAIVGGLIGAVAGSAGEQALSDTTGIEYIVAEDNGPTITVVQSIAKDYQPIVLGQHVMVQTSGKYQRLLPIQN